MKKLLLIPALILSATVLSLPAPADDTPVGPTEGWVSLFNGKDLTGWKLPENPNPRELSEIIEIKNDEGVLTGYDGKMKKDGTVEHLWRVENGELIGSGPSTHLFSERKDYVNFIFYCEAKINDHGNSGQYFRTKFGPGFPAGYEAQINATHSDPIRTGSLYPDGRTKLKDHKKELCVMDTAPHKPDEWFTQEVTAIGNHIQINVNGRTTVLWEDPDNTFTKGHFALQGHNLGTVVNFRKIEVKELK
jgi:3-keto-disaccharide hydrolase